MKFLIYDSHYNQPVLVDVPQDDDGTLHYRSNYGYNDYDGKDVKECREHIKSDNVSDIGYPLVIAEPKIKGFLLSLIHQSADKIIGIKELLTKLEV